MSTRPTRPPVHPSKCARKVMAGHSQTRWHWGDPEGSAEPPIPWHSHLFPDGSPVSYTEVAAIRRYTTGVDEFVALRTFLADSLDAPESWLELRPGEPSYTLTLPAPAPPAALYELTVWPGGEPSLLPATGALLVRVRGGGGGGGGGGSGRWCEVLLNATAGTIALSADGVALGAHDMRATGLPEGGIVGTSWNMLRLLVQPERVRVWFNPQFPDVTGGSVPPADEARLPRPMPPRIDALVPPRRRIASLAGAFAGGLSVEAVDVEWRVDYMSVLPPVLYSEDVHEEF